MVTHPSVPKRKCLIIVDVNRFLTIIVWVAEAAAAHSAKLGRLLESKADAEGAEFLSL